MAWSTPPTFVAGNVLTAAQMNAYVRDNTLFLYTPPMVRAYNAAAFTHNSSGNWLAVTCDSERFDTDSMHSTVSNTARLIATSAGKYIVGGGGLFTANGTGVRCARLTVNASTQPIAQQQFVAGDAAFGNPLSIGSAYAMAAADYFQFEAYQSSGANRDLLAGGASIPEPHAWAMFIGN